MESNDDVYLRHLSQKSPFFIGTRQIAWHQGLSLPEAYNQQDVLWYV